MITFIKDKQTIKKFQLSFFLFLIHLPRTQEITLTLQEPGKSKYMGVIYLSLTLQPKTQEEKEQVRIFTMNEGGKRGGRGGNLRELVSSFHESSTYFLFCFIFFFLFESLGASFFFSFLFTKNFNLGVRFNSLNLNSGIKINIYIEMRLHSVTSLKTCGKTFFFFLLLTSFWTNWKMKWFHSSFREGDW